MNRARKAKNSFVGFFVGFALWVISASVVDYSELDSQNLGMSLVLFNVGSIIMLIAAIQILITLVANKKVRLVPTGPSVSTTRSTRIFIVGFFIGLFLFFTAFFVGADDSVVGVNFGAAFLWMLGILISVVSLAGIIVTVVITTKSKWLRYSLSIATILVVGSLLTWHFTT